MSFLINNAYVGNTVPLDVAVTLSGSPYNLTGATLYFTISKTYGSEPLFSYSTGEGIVVLDAAAGTARVTLPAADTIQLPALTQLHAELEILTSSGDVFTVEEGKLSFRPRLRTS